MLAADVLACAIVGGNPAKLIRRRFPDEIVQELERIAWWDWPVDRISRHLRAITGADIQALKAAGGL